MNHLRMFGLALAAAGALMAFTGSASANPVLTSPAGADYTGEIHMTLAPGTSSLFKAGFTEKTCTETTIKGKVETNNTTHAAANISTFAFGKCNHLSKTIKNGTLTVFPGGKVTGTGGEWTTEKSGVSCVYGFGSGTLLGTIKGGNPATLSVSASVPRISGGFLCANPSAWTASFIFTTPVPLLVD